ncbi:MAG: ABC transporter permease, partial [Thermoleophilia bacterium]
LKSMQGFQMIMNFIMMPMFFISGAMYPLANAPTWLDTLAKIDPLTYGVDALRGIMLADIPSRYSFTTDISVIVLLSLAMLAIAVSTFSRQT